MRRTRLAFIVSTQEPDPGLKHGIRILRRVGCGSNKHGRVSCLHVAYRPALLRDLAIRLIGRQSAVM